MRNLSILFIAFLFISSINAIAQPAPSEYEDGLNAITLEAVKGQLDFLASDWTEGRETSKRGEYIASDYIASIFSVYGVEPGGDLKWFYPSWQERQAGAKPYQYRSFFQEITLLKYKSGDDQVFKLNTETGQFTFSYETDFSLNTGSIAREIESDLIFVGYGYVNEDEKYDDYKGLDVKGKVVVRLYGYPGHNDTASEAYKKFHPQGRYAEYYLNREKDDVAEEKGVAGIISIYQGYDRTSRWTTNTPFRYNKKYYEGEENLSTYEYSYRVPGDSMSLDPLSINLSKRAAHEVLRGSGINIEAWEKNVAERMKPDSKPLPGKSVFVSTSVESELVIARNVIGVIPGKDSTEAIVIGGHYDHIGTHKGYIWNGADDNASGTVGVMTVAKACMATGEQPEKTIVFAAWTGEEKGLIGSRYFVEHPYVPKENIKFYLNYDMISRDSEDDSLGNQCSMSYTAGNLFLEDNTNTFLEDYDIDLDIEMKPTTSKGGGSDHSPFARKDIPFFYFMAGWHDEYHTPMDDVSKANYEKTTNIVKIGFLNIWKMANE